MLITLALIGLMSACASSDPAATPVPSVTPTATGTATFSTALPQIPTSTPSPTYSPMPTGTPTPTYYPALQTAVAAGECIGSFDELAYFGPSGPRREWQAPGLPWQVEPLPPDQLEGPSLDLISVTVSRSIDGVSDIWLNEAVNNTQPAMLRYDTIQREWEIISPYIGDPVLFVRQLFVTSDGAVWGGGEWDNLDDYGGAATVPALARFNETTRRFEVVEGAMEVTVASGERYFNWSNVLLDDQDHLWFFRHNDGIYRFNTADLVTEKWVDLPSYRFRFATMSPQGTIYIIARDESATEELDGFMRSSQVALYEFIPETRQLRAVDSPINEWPPFANIQFDQTGRLWFGATGYRDLNNVWHLIHPDPEYAERGIGYYFAGPPALDLVTSDGRLWFHKWQDTGGWAEGIAWYDPDTGEGCYVTNMTGEIIEDAQQRLWTVMQGDLYSYPLNP